jgi:predicted kinase
MAERTYRAVIEEARVALAAGYSVIVDGVFARPDERAAVATLAAKSSVPFDAFWLVAPQEELERRVTNRRGNISDATAEVVKMQAGYELGTIDWRELETRQSPEATLAQALTTLGLA